MKRLDPEVGEIISHFEQDRFWLDKDKAIGNWAGLTPKEKRVIEGEWRRCNESFRYAAGNYFKIIGYDQRDTTLQLWESQEYVLQRLESLRVRNRRQLALVIKARRMGLSILMECLCAWRTLFFANTSAIEIGSAEPNSKALFSNILYIVDNLPWWLRPMIGTREYKEGIHFINPNVKQRLTRPGLNSKIIVQSAADLSAIAEGLTLNFAHCQEAGSWSPRKTQQIISADLIHALVRSRDTIGVIETTANLENPYLKKLWQSNFDMGDLATWETIFVPSFMEKTRFIAPEPGWRPDVKELKLRERVQDEWLQCNKCSVFRLAGSKMGPALGGSCRDCATGIFEPYIISDGQLRCLWEERLNAQKQGREPYKLFLQELASTPEEAFQTAGYSIFPSDVQDYVSDCVRKHIFTGFFDRLGNLHGPIIHHSPDGNDTVTCHQAWCKVDHSMEDNLYVRIWEWPSPKHQYHAGVDVGEGLGGDFSVIWMDRYGGRHAPDVHVATMRSNTIDPVEFGRITNWLGRLYNEAMLTIEVNKFDTTAHVVTIENQYPNLYRWKYLDNVRGVMTNKLHWETNSRNKDNLYLICLAALRDRAWVPRDTLFSFEIKDLVKGISGRGFDSVGDNDDVAMAAFISYTSAHQLDYSDGSPRSFRVDDVTEEQKAEFSMACVACGTSWQSNDMTERCRECRSIMTSAKRNIHEQVPANVDIVAEILGEKKPAAAPYFTDESYANMTYHSGGKESFDL